MENTNIITSNIKPSILSFIFQSCWDVLLPYLSNLEIGKLDLVLTDISLRNIYFSLINEFYSTNNIYDFKELDWIISKHVSLTKCQLEFPLKGTTLIFIHILYAINICCLLQIQSIMYLPE